VVAGERSLDRALAGAEPVEGTVELDLVVLGTGPDDARNGPVPRGTSEVMPSRQLRRLLRQ